MNLPLSLSIWKVTLTGGPDANTIADPQDMVLPFTVTERLQFPRLRFGTIVVVYQGSVAMPFQVEFILKVSPAPCCSSGPNWREPTQTTGTSTGFLAPP